MVEASEIGPGDIAPKPVAAPQLIGAVRTGHGKNVRI
jgi:hypothetical protein